VADFKLLPQHSEGLRKSTKSLSVKIARFKSEIPINKMPNLKQNSVKIRYKDHVLQREILRPQLKFLVAYGNG